MEEARLYYGTVSIKHERSENFSHIGGKNGPILQVSCATNLGNWSRFGTAGAIRTDANETETVQRINVVDIRPYPVAKNDLALMKLERKVSLQPGTTEKIRIAASKWAYDPDEVFIMGWGQTNPRVAAIPAVLS
ncbi:unnamed protein product, partial [Mesorhabditis spiculigera]